MNTVNPNQFPYIGFALESPPEACIFCGNEGTTHRHGYQKTRLAKIRTLP